jgi:hypothetical protein
MEAIILITHTNKHDEADAAHKDLEVCLYPYILHTNCSQMFTQIIIISLNHKANLESLRNSLIFLAYFYPLCKETRRE